MPQKVKFTEKHLAVLLAQSAFMAGAQDGLRAIQAEGMEVQKVLPSGRVNVTFMAAGHPQYRTFSPRQITAF
jgi:hypothetical protein